MILIDVTDDLQVGFKIDKGKHRGAWIESADIGVRIPSVENFYDRFEIHVMRNRGFREAQPSGWLTFWRPTYSSLELEERGLGVNAILRDFTPFYELIAGDPECFRSEIFHPLSQARRPEWATAPAATMLITKALLARTLQNPDANACGCVDELIENEPITKRSEVIIEQFCQWLRSTYPTSGKASSGDNT